jgi:hypothetical protein
MKVAAKKETLTIVTLEQNMIWKDMQVAKGSVA